MDIVEFVRQHGEWIDKNFPNQPLYLPAAGAFEECGEIMQCVVKLRQEKKWGKEPRHADRDFEAEYLDAVADCAIYLDSLCHTGHVDWLSLLAQASESRLDYLTDELSVVLLLAQSLITVVTSALGFRVSEEAVILSLCCLKRLRPDLVHVVTRTWEEVVSKRSRLTSNACSRVIIPDIF